MGSTNLSVLSSSLTLYYSGGISLNPSKTSINPELSSQFRCSFSSRPRWDPYPDSSRADRLDFDDDFGLGGAGRRAKRRNWWSDDDDDDEEEEEYDGFGFGFGFEEPSAIDWIFKILGAFAWMIPVVGISALLGTGSNSLIMALVLPLGQTALSLAMDKLWGGPSPSPEPRRRRRSKPGPEGGPFASRSQKTGRGARGPRTGTRPVNGSYQNYRSSAKGGSKFGGWDELDDFSNTSTGPKAQGKNQNQNQNQKAEGIDEERMRTVKLSLRRKGDRPLFFRLLIAVFPFLGSWTRFLF